MDLATRQATIEQERQDALERAARAVALTEQEMDVLRLYAVGATLNQLAKALGVKTTGGAVKGVRRILAKYAGVVDSTPVTEARALMMQRLELILAGNLPAAAMGDEKAGKIALAAIAQQARLLGLDAPRRHEHEHHLHQDTPEARAGREQAALKSLTEFGNRIIEGETA